MNCDGVSQKTKTLHTVNFMKAALTADLLYQTSFYLSEPNKLHHHNILIIGTCVVEYEYECHPNFVILHI